MPEQIQQIINRVLDWWRRFTRRQQVLIVSLAAVVVASLVIMGVVLSRPNMVELISCEDAQTASTVAELLDGEGIKYEVSTNGMTYTIREEDYATASILLGTNSIPSSGYSINDVIDGSFSTTEADKQKRYQLYLEEHFADYLETIAGIKEAHVTLSLAEDDGTIISQNLQSYASVILNLTQAMSEEKAAGIARYIATELGNDSTENIVILDSNGNTLFSGGEEASAAGMASSNQTVRDKVASAMSTDVQNVFLATDVYDNVEVGMNLIMNFDQETVNDYHYYVDEGQEQGYLDSRSQSTSESNTGVGGTPGVTSNDDDSTYVIEDGQNSNSSTSEIYEDFLPSETITSTVKEVGTINYDESSVTVVATSFVMYNEDNLKALGQLDDMTFDEFVAANSDRVRTDVDDDFYDMVSNATGIPENNISIVAYEIPMFQYSEGSAFTIQQILEIVLAVLILAMLAFVVIRSLRTEEEEEVEEEVSIDDLMAATAEEELEDIDFSDKSEARLLIEKFVDEKPEAVASLLRNWLNEDWG